MSILQGITGAAGGASSILGGGGGGGLLGGGASPSPWGMAGKAADAIAGFMPLPTEYAGDKGLITLTMDNAYDKISDVAMNFGPVGTIVGGAMKVNKLASRGVKAIGGGTDGMTTQDAILGSSFFLMSPLGLVNGFFGKKTDTITKNAHTQSVVGSSYGGTYDSIDNAVAHSGKKYGLLSSGARKDMNALIHTAGRQQNILTQMANGIEQNNDILANQSDIASAGYAQSLQGGYDLAAMRAAKQGMKLFSKELRLRTLTILASKKRGGTIEYTPFVFDYSMFYKKQEDLNDILEFKEGGKMNVIPEGNLHARIHHMEEADPNLKDLITKKGIPVIIDKGLGEVELQAEIELNEIIFIKEVTQKIEELAKKYHSDESSLKEKDDYAIEAGKIIAKEIMENTDDRTGLINTIE